MAKHFFLTLAVVALLPACGSAPTIETPDGTRRQPINSHAAIAEYLASLQTTAPIPENEAPNGDSVPVRTYAAPPGAVDQTSPAMKPPLLVGQTSRSQPSPAISAVIKKKAAEGKVPPASVEMKPGESIQPGAHATRFRSTFPQDDASFAPSAAFREALLLCASKAQSISILSTTDADRPSDASALIASARAENVKQYLVDLGVEPSKITVNYLDYGGFVADNATDTGRQRNRRVDIEVVRSDKQQEFKQLQQPQKVSK